MNSRILIAALPLLLALPLLAEPGPALIDTVAPTVEASIPSGNYNRYVTVEFKTSEPATVYYTLDNTDPTEKSLRYSGLLSLSEEGEVVLQYMAVDLVGNRSRVYRQNYLFDTQAPRLNIIPAGGRFGSAIQAKIVSSEAAIIHYTLDNSPPSKSSPVFRNALSITASCTLKAVGFDRPDNASEVATAVYEIDTLLPAVSIAPEAGVYNKPVKITFSVAAGARVFYSLDEFAALMSYTPYTGPVLLNPGQTIVSFFAENEVGTRSDLEKKVYIVDIFPPKVDAIANDYPDKRSIMLRANEKADFFYTLDGTLPTEQSRPYRGPIDIPKKSVVTLRVFARDMAGNASHDFLHKFSDDQTPPRIAASPAPGLYNRPLTIFLRSNEPARIFYTLDNTVPTLGSPVYSDSIGLTRDGKVVITFFGVDEGDNRSELYSVVYTVDRTPPGVRPRIQGHLENKEFTVSFALSEGDRVFYTTDGTDPTPASREYRSAFNVSAGATVKYVGVDAAGNRTEVRTLSEIVLPGVTASPPGGIYGRVVKIQLAANLPGKVYYRLESKRQEKGDFLEYAAPVMLNANGMYKLEYYSADRQGKPSPIKEETYVIDLFPPEIEVYTTRNPVDSTITVHFQSSENAAIYYTQDGTNPFTSPTARIVGNKYFLSKDKIVFKRASEDLQLTFMGEDVAGNKSGLYQFDINLPTVMASPPGGEYNAILNVALVTYNQATVYYTLDNSAPTEYSAIYRQPIPITKKTVVKYFAIDGFGYRGRTGESRYLIDLPPRPAFEIRSDSLLEGLPVVFDASVSVDEEGGPNSLQFQWDFDGDSRWDTEWSPEPRVTRFFRTAGVRRIILRARDSSGQVASVERRVTILRDCPQGMAPLTDGDTAYCMDRYEYPNVKGEKPLTNVTWVDAVMRCRSMGKDLCSRSEWRAACAGSRQGAYPYGSEYRPEECNTENRSLSGSGEYDRCGSDKGVFDLTGNAWEWVLDRDEGYNLIAGGNYYYGRNARCDATFYNLLSNTDKSIGFRCCK